MNIPLLKINRSSAYKVKNGEKITFFALYKGKKKNWSVPKELYELLLELETRQ